VKIRASNESTSNFFSIFKNKDIRKK